MGSNATLSRFSLCPVKQAPRRSQSRFRECQQVDAIRISGRLFRFSVLSRLNGSSMAMPAPAVNGTPLSVAALQIVQASLKEDTALSTLAGLAESDPAFAIRVLSLVNSAAFGVGRKVTDVKQAAALLGIRGLRNI